MEKYNIVPNKRSLKFNAFHHDCANKLIVVSVITLITVKY